MDASDKFFVEIITALNNEGILQQFVLIGGWCQKIFRHLFGNPHEISALRTADIDFLVKDPTNIRKKVNLPNILKKFGFDEEFFGAKGYVKYVHPELEIEFLVPEIGKARDKPYLIKYLNINAQSLRYLDILEKYTKEVEFYGLNVIVPQPTAFVLNKFLISQRRGNIRKKEKDILTAKELGEYLLKDDNQIKIMKEIFSSLHIKSQKNLLETIKNNSGEIYNILI